MEQTTLTEKGVIHQLHGEAVLLAKTPARLQQAQSFEGSGKRYMRLYETTHVGGRITHDALFSDTLEGLTSVVPVEASEVFARYFLFEWDLGINLVRSHLVD